MATPESCDPKINQTCIAKGAPKRNNYFSGKYISAEDLTLEQEYFINKIKQMNSELSGYGIINGLTISGFNNTDKSIVVNPGIGIDSCGNVLAIYNETKFTLPDKLNDGDYIYLRFLEKGKNRVARKNDEECGDECCFNHIVEDMKIYVDETLLTLGANDICNESKEMKIHHKLEYLEKGSTPFLLLGRYKYIGKQGKIDNSDRVMLHTNAELSKRLCHLLEHHVSSVNGEYGDVTAVSTINSAYPDEDGDFEIIAGNNISISTEDGKLQIDTKSKGAYKENLLNLEKHSKTSKPKEIVHNFGSFPLVDIYRKISISLVAEKPIDMIAYHEREIVAMAHDLGMDTADYLEIMGGIRLSDIGVKPKSETERVSTTALPRQQNNSSYNYKKSKKDTITVLHEHNVTDYSSTVIRSLKKPIYREVDHLILMQRAHYEKILGEDLGGDDKIRIKVKVTHTSRNIVKIENLDPENSIELLVILKT